MAEGLTTEVNIRFIQHISGSTWLIEFETIEHMPEEEIPTVKRWRALVVAGFFRRGYPNRDERMKNPFNFYVDQFSLVSRAVTQDNKDAKFID